jgi:hypothetical protein
MDTELRGEFHRCSITAGGRQSHLHFECWAEFRRFLAIVWSS